MTVKWKEMHVFLQPKNLKSAACILNSALLSRQRVEPPQSFMSCGVCNSGAAHLVTDFITYSLENSSS